MIGKTLAHYEIVGTLGKGGMGEVYRAQDTKLGREVALKVLPPDLARNPESRRRFEREAKVVATLRHPNIVTIYSVEEADGYAFLTMELVEGTTLGEKIPPGGMPLEQLLSYAVPLADALGEAHDKGITHRDLKPANVMIGERGRVQILDFGLAKLLHPDTAPEAAPDGATMAVMESQTREGHILGTTYYMSPEQTEGKSVDHRSDLFALGILLYEMATGRRPFEGDSSAAVVSSILRDTPPPASEIRRDLPQELTGIIERCLEKNPEKRTQSAREVRNQLQGLQAELGLTTGFLHPGAGASAGKAASPGAVVARALLIYVPIAVLVGLGVRALVHQVGLPDWVMPGALVLLAAGVPMLAFTAAAQARKSTPSSSGSGTGHRGPRRKLFTWQRAVGGGVLAFALWGLVVAGYMVTRKMGVGPAASLVSAGLLEEQSQVLVADFENNTDEELLGETLKEAFAIDLSQSRMIQVVPTGSVIQALAKMEKPQDTPLTEDLAREIAIREGIKAYITGRVAPAGDGYVLSTRLVSTEGDVLVALRENAADSGELITAIDGLSHRLRDKIGESLKTIRGNRPLEDVTTGSLAALQKYTQAVLTTEYGGDDDKAIALLNEAIAIDSTFAMAHRKVGVILGNNFRDRTQAFASLTTAYRLRTRLPERERYLTEAMYATRVLDDRDLAVRAYEELLEINPRDTWALNNLALLMTAPADLEKGAEYLRRAYEIEETPQHLGNLITKLYELDRVEESDARLAEYQKKFPDVPAQHFLASMVAAARGRYEVAEAEWVKFGEMSGSKPSTRASLADWRANLALIEGRLKASRRYRKEAMTLHEEAGEISRFHNSAANQAIAEAMILDDTRDGLAGLEAALARHPIDEPPLLDRQYTSFARAFSLTGDLDRSREIISRYEQEIDENSRKRDENGALARDATIAMAEGRWIDARTTWEMLADESRPWRWLQAMHGIGMTYRAQADADSAIVFLERYVDGRNIYRFFMDQARLSSSILSLGELHDARGDTEKALRYYSRFAELWKNADPELQPRVQKVQERITHLVGREKSSYD